MTKNSDQSLLLTILNLPLVLAIGMAVAAWGFGEMLGPDTVAMFMMMILMFSALSAQSLGRKALDTGPRALARYLGFALGMFGMVIIGKVPPAEMTLGQMLQGWLWFPAIFLFVPALAAIRPLRALRRHPRALRILAQRGAIMVWIIAIFAALNALAEDASPAQGVWTFCVWMATLASGGVSFAAYRGVRRTRLGKIAVFLAQAVPLVAMMFVFVYAMKLGQIDGLGDIPFGSIISGGIGVVLANYIMRGKKAGA